MPDITGVVTKKISTHCKFYTLYFISRMKTSTISSLKSQSDFFLINAFFNAIKSTGFFSGNPNRVKNNWQKYARFNTPV